MILRGSHADREQVRHLFVALAFRQQLYDFLFPASQATEFWLSAVGHSGMRSVPLRTVQDNPRYRRTHKSPATQDGLSRREKALLCVRFQYVAVRPGAQRSLDQFLFVVHAQNQDMTG